MVKLTTSERNRLPDSAFAVVTIKPVRNKNTGKIEDKKDRKFPVDTLARAISAKAYKESSDLTPAEKSKVVRKANKKIYGIATTNTAKAKRKKTAQSKRKY